MVKIAKYMISDGNGTYIRRDFAGRYTPVRNETLADTWDSKTKAQNVLKSQINKNMRRRYKIVEVVVESSPPEVSCSIPPPKKVNEAKEQKIKELSGEDIEDTQLDKWARGIDSFNGFILDMEERKNKLSGDLSNIDKEITDIQHYIEFGNFNAYQGWLAFSMLRHRLKKRGKIKNEFQILSQIGECKINSAMVNDIQAAIHKINNKSYTPRVLPELFE